jgi:hypothetical protein
LVVRNDAVDMSHADPSQSPVATGAAHYGSRKLADRAFQHGLWALIHQLLEQLLGFLFRKTCQLQCVSLQRHWEREDVGA